MLSFISLSYKGRSTEKMRKTSGFNHALMRENRRKERRRKKKLETKVRKTSRLPWPRICWKSMNFLFVPCLLGVPPRYCPYDPVKKERVREREKYIYMPFLLPFLAVVWIFAMLISLESSSGRWLQVDDDFLPLILTLRRKDQG